MAKNKRLYVLRHGNAEPFQTRDEDRNLTDLGVAEIIQTAQQFLQKNEKVEAVFVSPYIRAQQSAEALFSVLSNQGVKIETSTIITPYGKENEVADWLESLPYKSILLITHQPFAQELVEYLAADPLSKDFSMKTACLASLEGEFFAAACCQFRWRVCP